MVVVHLTASTFYGGPERQMLGLARSLGAGYRSVFLAFAEKGRCRAFVEEARRQGAPARALRFDTPHLHAAVREITDLLPRLGAEVLCCHGYKADLLGRLAARRAGIPVVAVARGWTGESLKIRLYETLDRLALRWMDRVVCVSEGQAVKVRRTGVPSGKITVIRNAIHADRFERPDPTYRKHLADFFPQPRRWIVGAAGRLSPEKGFDVLIEAAWQVVRQEPSVGFILFGEGPLQETLRRQIEAAGLRDSFILGGFRHDLDRFLPFFNVLTLPSHTEGLPNVVLEGMAASVPVVATAVGGTPEVIEEGVSGYLVPPGDAVTLAQRIGELLRSDSKRAELGRLGRERVRRHFSFEAQSRHYRTFFEDLRTQCGKRAQRTHLAPLSAELGQLSAEG
jgi:glycosyltransferase involved in cell wall biosynthesis